MSSPVSRVLSFKTVIYLRRISLYGSSRLSDYRPDRPIQLALLRMGFTWHKALPQCRWALTPPFHPYPINRAVYFCCTFLRVASTGISPASCPAKLGLSSSMRMHCRDRSDYSNINLYNSEYGVQNAEWMKIFSAEKINHYFEFRTSNFALNNYKLLLFN